MQLKGLFMAAKRANPFQVKYQKRKNTKNKSALKGGVVKMRQETFACLDINGTLCYYALIDVIP